MGGWGGEGDRVSGVGGSVRCATHEAGQWLVSHLFDTNAFLSHCYNHGRFLMTTLATGAMSALVHGDRATYSSRQLNDDY